MNAKVDQIGKTKEEIDQPLNDFTGGDPRNKNGSFRYT